jgi:hypothetical protein
MSNLITKNSSQPTPLPMHYKVLDGRQVKVSVVIGNARSGAVFFFLDGEPVVTVPGEVTVTPRTVTFANGQSVRGKVLTVAANISQGNATGSDKWSMEYTMTGGQPPSTTEVNRYPGKGPIVYFEDTITFE